MKNTKWFLLFVPAAALAAGSGGAEHGPSVIDVLWPAFNFCLLFGFLGWKMWKPLSRSFTRNAEAVEETYVQAEKDSNDAAARIEDVQSKMNSFNSVKEGLVNELKDELSEFNVKSNEETKNQIGRMKSDNVLKIDYEKLQLTQELNTEVVDQIIAKTKETIADNAKLRSDVTGKLLAGLQ
ncbi:MAG: hypothetical protein KAG61_02005 [Bacteriovoracaceae bacterium]|nr:hypothetical protein [Bacteriovoracaceae bacterium]